MFSFTVIADTVHSPLFPYQAGVGLAAIVVLVVIVWLVARTFERRHFSSMLRKFSQMTVKLKEAEHLGQFGSFAWGGTRIRFVLV